jgi:transaldolase
MRALAIAALPLSSSWPPISSSALSTFPSTRDTKKLAAEGANVQRPLWASTSTKDPTFPDTMYVVDLVVSDTVNTMPEATIKATADHGELRGDTVHGTYDDARKLFADLEKLGIGYDDVVQVLEDEGVAKFEASWNELLDTIRTNMGL